MSHPIEVVCHKGANKHAPENTMAAARLCVEWGADYIEIDVHTSQDGVLYVFHGPYLQRTSNGQGHIVHHTSVEIDALDAGSWFSPAFAGERIPRLDKFLAWVKGKAKVFLDVKNADPQKVVDAIYAAGLEKESFFWSADPDWVRALHTIDPSLAIKINVKTSQEAIQAKEEFGASLVETSLEALTPELLSTCRQLGLRVMIYYPGNDPAVFRRILSSGAELINTDYGDEFLRVMKTELKGKVK